MKINIFDKSPTIYDIDKEKFYLLTSHVNKHKFIFIFSSIIIFFYFSLKFSFEIIGNNNVFEIFLIFFYNFLLCCIFSSIIFELCQFLIKNNKLLIDLEFVTHNDFCKILKYIDDINDINIKKYYDSVILNNRVFINCEIHAISNFIKNKNKKNNIIKKIKG